MGEFTLQDMEKFAGEAWGDLGRAVVAKWAEFNEGHFGGVLRPIPLVFTNAQPYGKRLAFCMSVWTDDVEPPPSDDPLWNWMKDGLPAFVASHGRSITLNVPRKPPALRYGRPLLADNGALLHEMTHQYLFERGEDPKHDSEPWRREIMRLHEAVSGKRIWAGRSMTKRVVGEDGKLSKVVRINEPHADGTPSLGQMNIATWPLSTGIDLGKLGTVTPSPTLQSGRASASCATAPEAPALD